MSTPPPVKDPDSAAGSAVKVARAANRPPWWPMLALLATVILSVGLFGSSHAGVRFFAVEVMVGAGALSMGALLGFLFGIPRILTRDGEQGTTSLSTPATGSPDAQALLYRPSTNLEQVSDWLTKILIGVGLVEIDKASGALARVGRRVQEQAGAQLPWADMLTQAVIVVLAVLGFLASFLWTRIYYGAIQAGADSQAIQALRAQVSRQAESAADAERKALNAQKVTEAMLRGEIPVLPVPLETRTGTGGFQEEWPPALRERVERVLSALPEWDSDPTGEIFADAPTTGGGRVLTASVAAELGRGLMIALCLEHRDGPPLEGPVTFLLHPTFAERSIQVPVQDGSARTNIYSGGTFTVVAIADHGRTVLAFNLNRLRNAPAWFLAS